MREQDFVGYENQECCKCGKKYQKQHMKYDWERINAYGDKVKQWYCNYCYNRHFPTQRQILAQY